MNTILTLRLKIISATKETTNYDYDTNMQQVWHLNHKVFLPVTAANYSSILCTFCL